MLNCNGHLYNAFQAGTHTLKLNMCIHSQRRTPSGQDAELEPGSNSQIQPRWYHWQIVSEVPIGGRLGHHDHKVINKVLQGEYEKQLKSLGLFSPEKRRLRALITAHDFFTWGSRGAGTDLPSLVTSNRTRGNSMKWL